MNLSDFLDPALIIIDLRAETKLQAVDRLADLFQSKYPEKEKQSILKAVAEREELGSTSFGRGFAFPHARTDIINNLYIIIGIIRDGVKDKGPDEVPIKVVCLFITPANISRLYLQTLSGLANIARRPGTLDRMLRARSPEEIIEIVSESGIQIKEGLSVGDIMVQNVITVSPDDTLRNVANIMFQYNFDGVPVVDTEGNLLGDVSGKELIRSALPDYGKIISNQPELEPFENLLRHEDRLRVKDVMRNDVATISEGAPLVEAAATMLNRNADRLMVIHEGRLVGIISASDIISKVIRG
jgi:nitrogen PTS system EIIA component